MSRYLRLDSVLLILLSKYSISNFFKKYFCVLPTIEREKIYRQRVQYVFRLNYPSIIQFGVSWNLRHHRLRDWSGGCTSLNLEDHQSLSLYIRKVSGEGHSTVTFYEGLNNRVSVDTKSYRQLSHVPKFDVGSPNFTCLVFENPLSRITTGVQIFWDDTDTLVGPELDIGIKTLKDR